MKTFYKALTYKNNQKQKTLLFGVRSCTFFLGLTDSSQLFPVLHHPDLHWRTFTNQGKDLGNAPPWEGKWLLSQMEVSLL